ncbi:MAG: hypothetical protein ACREYE_24600, partial [Gammaproteobacteria bacterium]
MLRQLLHVSFIEPTTALGDFEPVEALLIFLWRGAVPVEQGFDLHWYVHVAELAIAVILVQRSKPTSKQVAQRYRQAQRSSVG